MARVKIAEFGIIQKNLANAVVTIYDLADDGSNSGVLSTLYQAATGTGERSNPQTLDENGQLDDDCYVDTSVMATIDGINALEERSIKKIRQSPLEFSLPFTSANYVAQSSAAGLSGTSTTSLAIAVGSKVFETQEGKLFHGENVRAYSSADPTKYMDGLASYTGTTLTLTVTSIGGSGTAADWILKVNGAKGVDGTDGDDGAPGAPGTLPFADAAGTVDAITADFTPDLTLSDGTMCVVISAGPNTVATPSFAPDGLTAHTIVKNGGQALAAGDTGAAGYPMYLEYNLANTRWELLNPVKVGGLRTLWIPSGAMRPSSTGGCAALALVATAANQPDISSLNFDATTIEYAQFSLRMPKGWNAGTVTAAFVWSHPATTVNFKAAWGIQAVSIADNEAMGVAYGTAQVSNDEGGTTDKQYITSNTPAITIGGTPAVGEVQHFRVYRNATDATNDTLAVDARLHGVLLFYTITTIDDT